MARVKKDVSPIDEPLTPEKLIDVLRQGVLSETARLPSVSSSAIVDLARFAQGLRTYARQRPVALEDNEQRRAVYSAIECLAKLLPALRVEYAAIPVGMARWELAEAERSGLDDLAAIDGLIAAVEGAQKRGLPHSNAIVAFGSPGEAWIDFAPRLAKQFHSALPEQSKAAGYRYVRALMPYLTGEHPKLETIESALKRKISRQ